MHLGRNVLFLLPFIFCLSPEMRAQQGEELVEKTFDAIYNLEFETASPLIDKMDSTSEPVYATLFRIEWYWWRYISTSGKDEKEELKIILDSLRLTTSDSLEDQLLKLIYLSYSIRFDYAHNRYLGLLMRNFEIRSLLNKVEDKLVLDTRREKQIFDLYSNLFIYADNVAKATLIRSSEVKCNNALAALEGLCGSEDPIVNTLSNYFTGKIYATYEDRPDAHRKYFERLVNSYPGNTIFKKILHGEE